MGFFHWDTGGSGPSSALCHTTQWFNTRDKKWPTGLQGVLFSEESTSDADLYFLSKRKCWSVSNSALGGSWDASVRDVEGSRNQRYYNPWLDQLAQGIYSTQQGLYLASCTANQFLNTTLQCKGLSLPRTPQESWVLEPALCVLHTRRGRLRLWVI